MDKVVSRNDSVNSNPCLHNDTLTDNNTTCLDNATITENYEVDKSGDQTTLSGSNSVVYWLSFVIICGFFFIYKLLYYSCQNNDTVQKTVSVNQIPFREFSHCVCYDRCIFTFLCSVIIKIISQDSQYFLIWFIVRMVLFSVFMSVLWCSVCAVVIERFIAIEFPYHYVKLNKKSTLYTIIVATWTFNIVVPCVLVIVNWLIFCGADKFLYECDGLTILRPFRIFVASVSCICFVVTVIVYSRISLSIRRHTRGERALQDKSSVEKSNHKPSPSKSSTSTKTILAIIMAFIALQFPYLAFSILSELRPEFRQIGRWKIMHFIISLCHEINAYVTLFLYIWKFSEFRMNFYYMFSKIYNKFKRKAEDLRLQVYDIVTFEKNTNIISEL